MKMTLNKLISEVGKILKKTPIYNDHYAQKEIDRMLTGEEHSFIRENFEFKSLVWGSDCSLSIDPPKLSVELNWSSTSRSVPMALAAINNYQKALSVAAEIQGLFDSTELVKEKE